jgi:hypothetical protein
MGSSPGASLPSAPTSAQEAPTMLDHEATFEPSAYALLRPLVSAHPSLVSASISGCFLPKS